MRNFINRGISFVADNPKTVFWSFVGTLGGALIGGGAYWWKKRQDTKSDLLKTIQTGEIAARNKRVDAECDIMTTAAKTACKMMEQATSLSPDIKALKKELASAKNEVAIVKERLAMAGNACPLDMTSSNENGNYEGCSSASLFNRQRSVCNWLVDNYMKVGQINLIVAGAGVGKSNLATMIAVAISKGVCPEFLPQNSKPSPKLPCVYYRLEDFDDELEGKYGKGEVFAGCNIRWFLPEDISEFNLNGFIAHLKEVASRMTEDIAVLIDPATKFGDYTHKEFVKGVEEAMRIAKSNGHTLTPVASIHLDEIKDWTCLSLENIKGGDKAVQLAGSVIAFRKERTGEKFRFIQCLKEPKGSAMPFNGQVLVCELVEKNIDNQNKYLYYQYVDTRDETVARPVKPKIQRNNEVTSVQKKQRKKAPNQQVMSEDEVFIIDLHNRGMKAKEIRVEYIKNRKKKICERTIKRYIDKYMTMNSEVDCA